MKPVNSSTYIDFDVENNEKDPKFGVGDYVRIQNKIIFAKCYAAKQSEEVFAIKKIKHTVPWTYIIEDLSREETIGTYYGTELQKKDQIEFLTENKIRKR